MRGIKSLAAAALAVAVPCLAGSNDERVGFDQRVLAAHNRERSLIGAEPLAWDRRLEAGARAWAAELARSGRFEHSRVDQEGENLWMGTTGSYSPEQMVGAWVGEKRDFRRGVFPAVAKDGDWTRVGHYTQLIWGRTRRVGCAVAANGRQDVLVCRYAEPGNVIGEQPI